MRDELLTLRQVAELLRVSPGYMKQIWPKLIKHGLNPIRFGGNGHLLFKKAEIMRLVDSWRVIREK